MSERGLLSNSMSESDVNKMTHERRILAPLVLIASLFVISTVAVSSMPEWNMVVRVIAILFVFTYMVFFLLGRTHIVKPNVVYLIFIVWILIGTVGGYNTLSLENLLGKLWTILQLIVVSFFLYSLALEMKSIKWLEWSFLLGVVVTSLWLLVTTGWQFGSERITGTQGNANSLAFVLLVSCVISLDLLRQYKSVIVKSALLLNIISALPILAATGSRKGMIGFFFLVVTWWVFGGALQQKGKRLLSMISVGVMLAVISIFAYQLLEKSGHFNRFVNLERYVKGEALVVQEGSLSERAELAKRGIGLALKHPFFGVGLDQFRFYDNRLFLTNYENAYAHSNVIEVLADTGFLGFTMYYSAYLLIGFRVYSVWRRRHLGEASGYALFCIAIGSILLVYELFSVTYYSKGHWLVMTLILSSIALAGGQLQMYAGGRNKVLSNETQPDESSPAVAAISK